MNEIYKEVEELIQFIKDEMRKMNLDQRHSGFRCGEFHRPRLGVQAQSRSLNKDVFEPKVLETVMNVVWEQFLNQIAVTAGEDFIRENRGLTLDLSNDALYDIGKLIISEYRHLNVVHNFEISILTHRLDLADDFVYKTFFK